MYNKLKALSFLGICMIIFSCSREKSVKLSLNFSTREQWRYDAKVLINGSINAGDTSTNYSGMAKLILVGTSIKDKPEKLNIDIHSVRLSSDFLDDAEKEDLKKQLENLKMNVSMENGTVTLSDSATLPSIINGSWGLDRSLAKVLPVIPNIDVSAGSKWERNKQAKIKTSHGDAMVYLFQAFIVDSIYNQNDMEKVSISWDLSYNIELENPDTSGLLDDLPKGGSGIGNAIVNTTEKSIEFARIDFKVDSKKDAPVRVGWNEIVELSLSK